jgi:hypothetical protein
MAIQIIRDTFLAFFDPPPLRPPHVTFYFLLTVFKTYMLGNIKLAIKKVPYKAQSCWQTKICHPHKLTRII